MAVPLLPTFDVGSARRRAKSIQTLRWTTAVKTQRPIVTDPEHVIIEVPAAHLGRAAWTAGRIRPGQLRSTPRTICRATSGRAYPPDDFRHRMLENVVAPAFTVALDCDGRGLAVSIADLRGTQDRVWMGRRGLRSDSVMLPGRVLLEFELPARSLVLLRSIRATSSSAPIQYSLEAADLSRDDFLQVIAGSWVQSSRAPIPVSTR